MIYVQIAYLITTILTIIASGVFISVFKRSAVEFFLLLVVSILPIVNAVFFLAMVMDIIDKVDISKLKPKFKGE